MACSLCTLDLRTGLCNLPGSVWYTLVAAADGNVTIVTQVASQSNVTWEVSTLDVFSGTSLRFLTPVSSSNSSALGPGISRVDAPLSSGTTYYVRVSTPDGQDNVTKCLCGRCCSTSEV